jgi:hypothetical protein
MGGEDLRRAARRAESSIARRGARAL